jgi:hypothetical protein
MQIPFPSRHLPVLIDRRTIPRRGCRLFHAYGLSALVAAFLTGCEESTPSGPPMMPVAGEIVAPASPQHDNLPLRRIVGWPMGADLGSEPDDPTKHTLIVRLNANYGLNDYQAIIAKTKPGVADKKDLMLAEMYVNNELGDQDKEQITIEATIKPVTEKEAKDDSSRTIYTLYSVTANGRTISLGQK